MDPVDALAPVIPFVTAPIVQLKVAPATLLVKTMFVVLPLQTDATSGFVKIGIGYNVTVNVKAGPVQFPTIADVGVTV